MKKQIKILLREGLLREYSDDFNTIISNTPYEIYQMIKHREKIGFKLIPKVQYKNALIEFMKYGQFMRFPEKIIFKWKDLLLENIGKLYTINTINGHDTHFPVDEFLDVFDYNHETGEDGAGEYSAWLKEKGLIDRSDRTDWENHSEFLNTVYNYDEFLPQFSNGQHMISDYGTKPLVELGIEMDTQETPEEIIVTINKILDVAHQRSDLAEIFIEGGSESLYDISNN